MRETHSKRLTITVAGRGASLLGLMLLVAVTCPAQQPAPKDTAATQSGTASASTPSPEELLKRNAELRTQLEEARRKAETNDQLANEFAELKAEVARTKEQIARLEAVVLQMAANQPGRSSATTAPAQQAVDQHDDAHRDARTTPEGLPSGLPRMQIHGFADMQYRVSSLEGQTNSFMLGQFDLFIMSRLSEKLSLLSEVVVQRGRGNTFKTDLQRVLLQYSPGDYLNFAFGRFHTAIGFYNTEYHHGSWFETAVSRPTIYAFEDDGGILPSHGVGITANGRIPSGSLRLGYIAEVSNGRTSRLLSDSAVQNFVDENDHKAVNLGIIARPDRLPGLRAGFSVYYDRLTPEAAPNIAETIMAGHVIYKNPEFEWLNELVVVRHSPSGFKSFNSPAFYTQVAKQFGRTRPFFRYQYQNVPDGDPVIGAAGLQHGPLFGVRCELGEFAAFKVQAERTFLRRLDAFNALRLQFAFTF